MNTPRERIAWSPLPGSLPEALEKDFARHSLVRHIHQTSLLFYALALFAIGNLTLDMIEGSVAGAAINAVFVFVCLGAVLFMRRLLDPRLLRRAVSLVALVITTTLLAARWETTGVQWPGYIAELLIIVGLCALLPIGFIEKLIYPALIICVDGVRLFASGMAMQTAAGIILLLAVATVISLVIHIRRERIHFEAFQSTGTDVAVTP